MDLDLKLVELVERAFAIGFVPERDRRYIVEHIETLYDFGELRRKRVNEYGGDVEKAYESFGELEKRVWAAFEKSKYESGRLH